MLQFFYRLCTFAPIINKRYSIQELLNEENDLYADGNGLVHFISASSLEPFRVGERLTVAAFSKTYGSQRGLFKVPAPGAVNAEGHYFKYVKPRVGLGFGGKRKLNSTLGLGFTAGNFQLDLAAGTWSGLLPTSSQGIGLAFGMRFERYFFCKRYKCHLIFCGGRIINRQNIFLNIIIPPKNYSAF